MNDKKITGSYYTDSDVVDYIVKNTIIPALIDLANINIDYSSINIDDYIYKPMKQEGYLPTEIEIEYKKRKERVKYLQTKNIENINDFALYNLNIKDWFFSFLEGLSNENKSKFLQALTDFKILEPSVGEGNFIIELLRFLKKIYSIVSSNTVDNSIDNLYGFDIRDEAIKILNDKIKQNNNNFKVKNFLTEVDFDFKFDVIIGNPPYVEYSKIKDYKLTPHNSLKLSKAIRKRFNEPTSTGYKTAKCGNLYGFFIERSINMLKDNGRLGMIVPISLISTKRMEPVIDMLEGELLISSFGIRPAQLFRKIEQRLSILIYKKNKVNLKYTTRYLKWTSKEREVLLQTKIKYHSTDEKYRRISTKKELEILLKLKTNHKNITFNNNDINNNAYYHSSPFHWVRVMDFKPYFYSKSSGVSLSSSVNVLKIKKEHYYKVIAVLNSSLFYWWFIINSDGRALTKKTIYNFPINLDELPNLDLLSKELMSDYKNKSTRKNAVRKTTGVVIYDEFYPRKSKHIIDKIDRVLAEHYDFTNEELDFILNYDIKYRMGLY